MKKHHINPGEKYSRLTIIKEIPNVGCSNRKVLARCVCGRKIETIYSALFTGRTKSCGCYSREMAAKRQYKHGMARTKFYSVFFAIKARCRVSHNKDYSNYGGRGILCLWNDFKQFKKEMYKSYLSHQAKNGKLGTTIERIDNNGDYCKSNCRWATNKEQANNRRLRLKYNRDATGKFNKTK